MVNDRIPIFGRDAIAENDFTLLSSLYQFNLLNQNILISLPSKFLAMISKTAKMNKNRSNTAPPPENHSGRRPQTIKRRER